MRDIPARELASWPVGRPFPLRGAMQRITLDVILRTVLGVDDGPLLATVRERFERLPPLGPNPTTLLPSPDAAPDEDGCPMSDDDLRDQMMTLLFAGHETTATALAWAVYRILQRPDVLAAIRAEYRRVVGGGQFRAEHVTRLEYLDATVKEAL